MGNTPRRFNLVEEAWISAVDIGQVSLRQIFSDPELRALGGNPIQKISVMKLLLAIGQAACTPQDDEEWKALGADGLARKALAYLEENKDLFWLYGESPFLQMPDIHKAKVQGFGAVVADMVSGNTTVLLQSHSERELTDGEKALQLVVLGSCALGGKKTDNTVVLTAGYAGKSNDKGKPSTGKPGPSLGFLGYLHSFLTGATVWETLWLNLVSVSRLSEMANFQEGLGIPPWEKMPIGENCDSAKMLKNSYMGRLVPLSRFCLLARDGVHYSEGITHPSHKEGAFDLSIAVDASTGMKALWTDPEKRPWRQLVALLSFMGAEQKNGFDCRQLRFGIQRAREVVPKIGIWSGGLRVTSNAGEQFVSGKDDYVESEVKIGTQWLGKPWFAHLKAEMGMLEEMAKNTHGAVQGYSRHLKMPGKDQAAQASNLFWQLAERKFQELVDACNEQTDTATVALRRIYAGYAHRAYDACAPRGTARQLEAWAAHRPNLGKYLVAAK